MNVGTSLPPHLERFIRGQLAAGRFHSEGEVIRTALRLLEALSVADEPPGPRYDEAAARPGRPPLRPDAAGGWEAPGGRRSPRGLLADLGIDVSFDDVRDARDELWAGLGDRGV
jgi:hypothetical protein